MKLTGRQARFVDEYLVDLNATQAAIRAGYSTKTARVIGGENLLKPAVKAALTERMEARQKRTEISQDLVLKILLNHLTFDIRTLYRPDGSLKAMHELDDVAATVLAGVDVVEMQGGMQIGTEESEGGVQHVPMYTKKVKLPDKATYVTLAMKHLGMLVDRTEITGADGGPVLVSPTLKAIAAARERQAKRIEAAKGEE